MSANGGTTAARPDDIAVLEGVHYAVDDKPIFRGLDIGIRRGHVTAIMGPSGTGKTTLLRLITGQVRPEQGVIEFDGQDVARLSRAAL